MTPKINLSFIIAITLSLFTSLNNQAQENFVEGTVIKKDGTQEKGLIDYRNWKINPSEIQFKSGGHIQTFLPQDLQSFHVASDNYFSAMVEKEMSSNHIIDIDFDQEFQIVKDQVFLREVVSNSKQFFHLQELNVSKGHFYIPQEDEYKLLRYKKYYIKDKSGRKFIKENKEFIRVVKKYLSECEELDKHLRKTEYNLTSLERLFKNYYKCVGDNEGLANASSTHKSKSKFGLLGGLTYNSINFSGQIIEHLSGGAFESNLNFTAGLYFDYLLARNFNKLSVLNELVYTTYNIKGDYLEFTADDWFTNHDMEISYGYIKINTLVKYRLTNKGLGTFLLAGMSNGLVVNSTNARTKDIKFFADNRIEETTAVDAERTAEFGWVIGAGIKLNKLTIEPRLEISNGMSNYVNLKSSVNRLSLIVSYEL